MTGAEGARAVLRLTRAGGAAGPERLALLAAIRATGSIAAAAKAAGLSYRGAWDGVQALNTLFERPLVDAQAGGAKGGRAAVTPAGEAVLSAYREAASELARVAARLDAIVDRAQPGEGISWRLSLRTSARNAFRGTVRSVTEGAVNAEVALDAGGGLEIVATVTRPSVAELGLAPGRDAVALIKASFVILLPGDAAIATSARNRFVGTVAAHEPGAVSDEIALDLDGGRRLIAVVTHASGEALGLVPGARAQALVKASHVILAVS